MKFEEGPPATISVGWLSKNRHVSVELCGTVSHVSVVRAPPNAFDTISDDILRKSGKIERPMNRYYKELQYFVECVDLDPMPSPLGEEWLKDLKIIRMA